MMKKFIRRAVIMIMAILLFIPGESGVQTNTENLYATAKKTEVNGRQGHAVQINGEVVFMFPEEYEAMDPPQDAFNIARKLNNMLAEDLGNFNVTPYLYTDEVVIKLGEQSIVTIHEELAEELETTATELALAWSDNINSIIFANDRTHERTVLHRGSTRLEQGRASWYGGNFHGRRTANGETFNQNALTAAHKTLPFGTVVLVTNMNTGSSVIVRINDRGPFSPGRHIDLSKRAAEDIGMIRSGTAPVEIKILTTQSYVNWR